MAADFNIDPDRVTGILLVTGWEEIVPGSLELGTIDVAGGPDEAGWRALSGTPHRVVHTYETVPYVALELSGPAVERLRSAGVVATVQEDTADAPTLQQSSSIVEAT